MSESVSPSTSKALPTSNRTIQGNRGRISVPEESIPYLHRIPTEIYAKENIDLVDGAASKPQGMATRILSLPGFDYFMGIVIVANLVVMIIETDEGADENTSPALWTEVFGYVALCLFVTELLMRLFAYQCAFWNDKWNVFDFVVVATDTSFCIIGLILGDLFPVSMLRVFRLAKLARVSKVLRVFPELRLLLAGLMSSFSAIFWGAVLLLFCLLVWAMIAVQFINPLNQTIDYGTCERCSRAYSSCMSATLTFWQQIVTGDSWGQVTIPLIEKYPETACFFIPMFLTVGMAVTNLILGVVVSVAQESKENLEEEEKTEKAFRKLKKKSHLLEICKGMDKDRSGVLDHEEVLAGFRAEGAFRDIVLSLDITETDFDIILAILDPDKKGFVSYKDLVAHLCTMRTSDMQFMLAWIKYYIGSIRGSLSEQLEEQHAEALNVLNLTKTVEQEFIKLEAKEDEVLNQEDMLLRSMSALTHPTFSEVQANLVQGTPAPRSPQMLGRPSRRNSKGYSSERLQNQPQGNEEMAKFGATSADTNDDMQSWLRKVSLDIETLRLELKDTLANVDCKLGAQVASISAAAAGQNGTPKAPVKFDSVAPAAACNPLSTHGSI